MNLEQAKRILNISEQDDKAAVKRKYRRMIGSCHPDAAGSDSPEHVRRTQEINEAYELLKKSDSIPASGKGDTAHAAGAYEKKAQGQKEDFHFQWKGEINEKAFCERNIYLSYSMDVSDEPLYYQAARGKYMWDPDEEEFALFLTSIRHASRELLEKTGTYREQLYKEEHFFHFQARLFQSLALQYIHPVKTLRRIAKPQLTDAKGREIYQFQAFVGTKGNSSLFQAIAQLGEAETVYPHSFEENKILAVNKQGRSLGHLSLEDDRLYFSVIPLLKKQLAKVKMTVKKVKISRQHTVKAAVRFYFRLEQGADAFTNDGEILKTAAVLKEYEEFCKSN